MEEIHSIFDIPLEIVNVEILPFLQSKEVLDLSLVSKQVNIICHNSISWKLLVHQEFQKKRIESLELFYMKLKEKNDWFEIYRQLLEMSRTCQHCYSLFYGMKRKTNFQKINTTNVMEKEKENLEREQKKKMKEEYVKLKTLFPYGDIKQIFNLPKEKFVEKIQLMQQLTKQTDYHFNDVDEIDLSFLTSGKKPLIKYIGEKVDGMHHGKGTFFFRSGSKYVGEFKNGERHGKGSFYWGDNTTWNGDTYEGGWKNGSKDGFGIYKHSAGDEYEGYWKDDQREGKGIFRFSNGDVYEGEWKASVKSGFGVYTHSDGEKYQGTYIDDEMNGYGVFHYKDGSYYSGDWKNSRIAGKGKMYSKKRDITFDGYFGYYSENNRFFKGIILDRTGKQLHKGTWKNGVNPECPEFAFHIGYHCLNCYECPIMGYKRYHCEECEEYFVCRDCWLKGNHKHPREKFKEVDLIHVNHIKKKLY